MVKLYHQPEEGFLRLRPEELAGDLNQDLRITTALLLPAEYVINGRGQDSSRRIYRHFVN